MAKELIVSVNGREKKIAIIENEKVTEFYIERGEGNQGIVGNIYKGRVMRVLPGMQSAFVDIGLERDAFLYVSDFFDEEEEFERIVIDKSQKGNVEDAQRVAAEQIALARVERERHIEATHERVEPLGEMELRKRMTKLSRTANCQRNLAEPAPIKYQNKHSNNRAIKKAKKVMPVDAAAGADVVAAAAETVPMRVKNRQLQPERGSRRRTSILRLSLPILRFCESSTKKRLRLTARCSRTPDCRSGSSIKSTPASLISKTTFAPPKLAQ